MECRAGARTTPSTLTCARLFGACVLPRSPRRDRARNRATPRGLRLGASGATVTRARRTAGTFEASGAGVGGCCSVHGSARAWSSDSRCISTGSPRATRPSRQQGASKRARGSSGRRLGAARAPSRCSGSTSARSASPSRSATSLRDVQPGVLAGELALEMCREARHGRGHSTPDATRRTPVGADPFAILHRLTVDDLPTRRAIGIDEPS